MEVSILSLCVGAGILAMAIMGAVWRYLDKIKKVQQLTLENQAFKEKMDELTREVKKEEQAGVKTDAITKNQETPSVASDSEGYCVSSKLMVFKFGEVNSNGDYLLSLWSFSTVRFLVNGEITVRIPLRSVGEIQKIESITNPIKVKSFGEGTDQGVAEVTFYSVKPGQEKMMGLKSTRRLNLKGKPNFDTPSLFQEREVLLRALFEKVLKTPYHEAAGAYTLVPTQNLRLLLYFPNNFLPVKIRAVQVSPKGEIIETGFRKEVDKEENLWIVECSNLKYHFGVYVCWVWPHQEKRSMPY